MTAYVVFVRNEVTDDEEMKQYQAKAPLAREGRTLKPLAFYVPSRRSKVRLSRAP